MGQQMIEVIDSHTCGEPTRTVIAGGPDLGAGSLADRRAVFRDRHDTVRKAIICEPRGHDVLIGALLCEPTNPSCAAGVIYFNNAGVLNMCGHGTMGVCATLAHLGRIAPGEHRLETPVGVVPFTLHDANRVTIRNVQSYRYRKDVELMIEGYGQVRGDIAWGGNWFFMCNDHKEELQLSRVEELTKLTWRIREALESKGITGRDGGIIDHIELTGPADDPRIADCKNFVLCPGKAYDRSPCGTGTSAKLACLVEDGKFKEGDIWRQHSIIGSLFEGRVQIENDKIYPHITGTAYITAEAKLILDPNDPFAWGIS